MALEHVQKALTQFVPAVLIIFYNIVSPLIGVYTENSESICAHKSAVIVHSIFFCWIILVSLIYLVVTELGFAITPTDLQLQGRYLILRMFPSKELAGKIFGGVLQFVVVIFWSLFVGPEPMSCWATITRDTLASFELARVTTLATIGIILFFTIYLVNVYSISTTVTLEEQAPIL
jgi:hypothetical protein